MGVIKQVLRNPDVSYEATDVATRSVLLVGAGLAVVTIACMLLVFGLITWRLHYRAALPSEALPIARDLRTLPPEPRLQTAPRVDFNRFRQEQLAALNSSGWVDRTKRIVHIPITEAMRLLVSRGIPPQDAPVDLNLYEPQDGARSTGFEGRIPQEPR